MEDLLSTKELEVYIKETYLKKLEENTNQKVRLPGIYFCFGNANSEEGTYIFSDLEGYHYLFTEKGHISKHEITREESQIAYFVLEECIFNIALQYATQNRKSGEDFRRNLFKKELDIWKNIDEDGYNMKISEIKHILKENPYDDSIYV